LRVFFRSQGVVDKAVGERVVQFNNEGEHLSFLHTLHLVHENLESVAGGTIARAEGICLSQMSMDLVEKTFNCRIHTSLGSRLELKTQFGEVNGTGVGLEHISV
jgi:hypothetical protein